MYGLELKVETEILSGDALGQHMNGIIKQATAYNTGLNVSGDTKLDKLRHAKLQARLAGLGTFAPDAFVLNPSDLEAIELLKTEEGGANKGVYLVGNPSGGAPIKMIWDLPVVESDSITAGTFLVGAFGTAAEIIDRMQATVEISFEHDQNFVKNLATVLCETRVGLVLNTSNRKQAWTLLPDPPASFGYNEGEQLVKPAMRSGSTYNAWMRDCRRLKVILDLPDGKLCKAAGVTP
jgi:HK97 family phage major capsid protein